MLSEIRRIVQTGKGAPRKRLIVCVLHVALWPILLIPRLFWPPRNRRAGANPPARILLIRIDGIGDLAISTAGLRALRERYPAAQIDLLTSDAAKPLGELLLDAKWIDNIFIMPLYARRLGQYRDITRQIRERGYDLGIDLRGDLRNVVILWAAGIPARLGLPDGGLSYLLTSVVSGPEVMHEAEEVAALVKLAGATQVDPWPRLPLRPDDLAFADRWLAEHGVDPSSRPVCAFHLSASIQSRVWPLERFVAVARRLRQTLDAQILVVGGKGEIDLAQSFARQLDAPVAIAAGQISIIQTAAVLSRCAVLIGNDSAPAHLAAYVGASVVDLFGPANPSSTRPLSPHATILLPRHPCHIMCDKQCVQPEKWCMLDHTVERVSEAAEVLVREYGSPSPSYAGERAGGQG